MNYSICSACYHFCVGMYKSTTYIIISESRDISNLVRIPCVSACCFSSPYSTKFSTPLLFFLIIRLLFLHYPSCLSYLSNFFIVKRPNEVGSSGIRIVVKLKWTISCGRIYYYSLGEKVNTTCNCEESAAVELNLVATNLIIPCAEQQTSLIKKCWDVYF